MKFDVVANRPSGEVYSLSLGIIPGHRRSSEEWNRHPIKERGGGFG